MIEENLLFYWVDRLYFSKSDADQVIKTRAVRGQEIS